MKPRKERSRAMARNHVALIRKEETTDYWLDIPDLPGCVSRGVTEEEARVKFKEALAMFLEFKEENGIALPAQRSREDVLGFDCG